MLWALSSDPFVRAEVLAAHDAAVVAAVDWFEHHGAVTRRGKDGIQQVDTRGLAIALFRQHTSRSADPQLHTHTIVAAKVQDPTGKWLSLDARFLKRQQRSIGWIYASALRAELTGRLGVTWGPVAEGHGDINGVPSSLLSEFSERTEQVDARLADLVRDWVDAHDGAEPDPRTLYRLERMAVLDSRPSKEPVGDAEAVGASWRRRGAELGVDCRDLPAGQASLPGRAIVDREPIIRQALAQVAASSSTWPTWLGRLPPSFRPRPPARLPSWWRWWTNSPPTPPGDALSYTGRHRRAPPVDGTADPSASTWSTACSPPARCGARRHDCCPGPERRSPPLFRRRKTTSKRRRPGGRRRRAAGAGGRPGRRRQDDRPGPRRPADGRPGAAGPGPGAIGEGGRRAGSRDRLAGHHAGQAAARARPAWRTGSSVAPAGRSTVVLDEASMASTDDLDALVALVQRHRWRLVCVGDPAQLPAVGRGGMFALWCERLPAHQLEEVRRFTDDWQAEASLGLRRGDPAAAATYAAHHRLQTVHPVLVADGVTRQFERLAVRGETVAITTASARTARAINAEIQRRRNPRREEVCVTIADGTRGFVGDRVATRRNVALVTDAGAAVRNRQSWTVTELGEDGSVVVAEACRGSVRLPAAYVARHVELGWAVTGYGTQGVTTDHRNAVVEPSSTRAGIYVAMTRGRGRNVAWIVDRTALTEAEEALAAAIARPANALSAHAVAARRGGEVPPEAVQEDHARRMTRRLDQLATESRRPRSLSP